MCFRISSQVFQQNLKPSDLPLSIIGITRVAAWLVGVIHPLSKSPWPPKHCRLRTIKMDKKMEDEMEAGPLCDVGTYMITNRILRSI